MSKFERKTKVRKIEELDLTPDTSKPNIDEKIMEILITPTFKEENAILNARDFKDGNDPLFESLDYCDLFGKVLLKETRKEEDTINAVSNPKSAKKVFNTLLGFDQVGWRCEKRFLLKLTRSSPLTHPYGDCLIGASRPSKGANFKAPLEGSGSTSYVHHLGPAANSLLPKAFFTTEALKKVSSSKKGKEGHLTLSHLCGNGGCGRPGHIVIESKKIQETRAFCHRLLKRCTNHYEVKVLNNLCSHTPTCFTNDYTNLTFYYYRLEDQ